MRSDQDLDAVSDDEPGQDAPSGAAGPDRGVGDEPVRPDDDQADEDQQVGGDEDDDPQVTLVLDDEAHPADPVADDPLSDDAAAQATDVADVDAADDAMAGVDEADDETGDVDAADDAMAGVDEADDETADVDEGADVEEAHDEKSHDAGRPGAPVSPARPGWAALGSALRFRRSRAQVLAGVLCAALGFALVVQVRQNNEASLADLSQADLVRILDETTTRGDALATEVNGLRRERDQLVSGSDKRQAALDALRRSAETQGILAGRLPAQGPGVVVRLTEPNGQITPATMLNMLEELRNSGAEAIDLNGSRVTASSAFAGIPGGVTLDDRRLAAPYVWTVIGDPDTIATALQIPGGALAAVRGNGGEGDVQRKDKVEVTSVRVLDAPSYATPVPATDG